MRKLRSCQTFQVEKPGISFGTIYTPGLGGTTEFTATVAQRASLGFALSLFALLYFQAFCTNGDADS